MNQESRVEPNSVAQDISGNAFAGIATILIKVASRLSAFAGLLAILCLVALLGLVLAQTLAGMLTRYFPVAAGAMSVSWEYAGYLMGAAFVLAMPHTLRLGGHIRVNVLVDNVSPPFRRALDIIASTVAFLIVTTLAHALVTMTLRSMSSNSLSTASLTPLWIPEGIFALSACLFALQFLARIAALLAGLPPEEPKSFVGAPVE